MRETEYMKDTPIGHRKNYGQFFTPEPVSRLMLQWVMKCKPNTILDPAFGLGVFYDEATRGESRRNMHFTGYEIDHNIIGYLNGFEGRGDLTLNHADYLEASPGEFDAIVCNPPYMRFQKFPNRRGVLPIIEEKIGKKLTGYSNMASIFLVKALGELSDNGNLAFIMPFEFFNAGYGEEIKKTLIETHLLKQIVIFSNEKEIFPDATTTVCVVLCKNDRKKDAIKITRVESLDEIESLPDISSFYHKTVSHSELPFGKKWSPIILSLFSSTRTPGGFIELSLYGSFTRGIATGANSFFALTKSQIDKLKIGRSNTCRCITKSPQVRMPVFTNQDFLRLYNTEKPVHCLDVSDHERAEAYIKAGEELGYHKRYLTSRRSPWYKIEYRRPAPIWFGVFNRGRFKVVRNMTSAVNFTCFHSFYPSAFGEALVDKLFVYLLSDTGQEIIKANKRSYGDNLDKFEPGDLNGCLCPNQDQFDAIKVGEAKEVIDVAKTNKERAIEMSNSLIGRIHNF